MNRMMVIVSVLEDELNITFKVTDRFTHLSSRIMQVKVNMTSHKIAENQTKASHSHTGPYRSEDDFSEKASVN